MRSKVRIFDEGYAPRGRDSSYLGFFYPLSYCFGLLLGPRCAMVMAYFVVLIGIWPILRSQLSWGYSRSKGLFPK